MGGGLMPKFIPRVPLWLVMILCLVIIAALAPFVLTKRSLSTKAHICEYCGLKLRVKSDEIVGRPAPIKEQRTFEDTELSHWFVAHLSTNCQHRWTSNYLSRQTQNYASLGGLRLWKISAVYGSSTTPSLIHLSPEDRSHLETLLRQNPDACRTFIHDRLKKGGTQ
jgi:hypothetical protein